jgi:hypothetical protein
MQVVYSPRGPRSPREEAADGSDSGGGSPARDRTADPFADGGLAARSRTRTPPPRAPAAPYVADLRRPSIDVLMMPSGPSVPPTEVAEIELGDPLSPRSAAMAGAVRLSTVGEAPLEPEPEPSAGAQSAGASAATKQDRWAGGLVEGQGVYTGWMLKKGETGNSWKRRYFACSLASKTLAYYDKPGGARCRHHQHKQRPRRAGTGC